MPSRLPSSIIIIASQLIDGRGLIDVSIERHSIESFHSQFRVLAGEKMPLISCLIARATTAYRDTIWRTHYAERARKSARMNAAKARSLAKSSSANYEIRLLKRDARLCEFKVSLCHLRFYEITPLVRSFVPVDGDREHVREARTQHRWNVAKAWLPGIRFPASLISGEVPSQLTSPSRLAASRGYSRRWVKWQRATLQMYVTGEPRCSEELRLARSCTRFSFTKILINGNAAFLGAARINISYRRSQ